MNICEKVKETAPKGNPELIGGHLYSRVGYNPIITATRDVYIYVPRVHTLFSIRDGVAWSTERGFEPGHTWEDVTNQYCLTKV